MGWWLPIAAIFYAIAVIIIGILVLVAKIGLWLFAILLGIAFFITMMLLGVVVVVIILVRQRKVR